MDLKELNKKRVVYALLLFIVLYAIIYSLSFAIGPSHMGDDNTYAFSAYNVSIGTFVQSQENSVLSIRILQIIPIGVFYKFFGVGILTSAAWDMTSFVLSVILVFFIGREVYDDHIGLLAAFLLAIFPLAAVYSTTMSDNIPMMFFVCLAAFAFIKATKENSKLWFFAFGVVIVAPPLTTPQGFELWVILGIFVLIELIRKKISINKTSLFFIYGFISAMLILFLFNYVNAGSPFITFSENFQYYGQIRRADLIPLPLDAALSFYPNVMFPYHITENVYQAIVNQNLNLNSLFNSYLNGGALAGFFFYALVLSVLYLIIKKDKNVYFPLVWLVVGILYLEFGPQHIGLNPLTYVLSHRLDRYLTLIAPPLVIIISAALITFVRIAKGKWKYIKSILCSLIFLFITAISLQTILFMHSVILASQYSQLQIAKYLQKLPNITQIYADSGYGDIAVYMNFNNISRFEFGYGDAINCSGVPTNTYVMIPRYINNEFSFCSSEWELVLSPQLTNLSHDVSADSQQQLADLYYVPQNTFLNR
ncbi:MAG: glycosyltransferase family 39 protein [Candidatus Micrarchaeales archaeon]